MNNQLVSVIIPVRNVEKYVERCIASLRVQTHMALEIIAVLNDSSDASEEICQRLAAEDTRVKVMHSELPGVSRARNVGIEAALGEYVMLVDADDFIHEKLIERLLTDMNEHDAAIATSEFEKHNVQMLGTDRPGAPKHQTVTSYEYAQKMLLGSTGFYGYSWCKLYRTNVVGAIRFDETLAFAEDADFLLKVLRQDIRVFVSSFIGYFYSQDTGGVTRDTSGEERLKSLALSKKFVNEAPDYAVRLAAECYYWRNAYYIMSQSTLSPENQNRVWAIMSKYRMSVIAKTPSPTKYRLIAVMSLLGKAGFKKIITKLVKSK